MKLQALAEAAPSRDARAGTLDPFEVVAARMEALSAPLSRDDGVRTFNDLYLAVTRAVGIEFANGRFEDPFFLARLAPIFSSLYFDAVEADVCGGTVPPAWAPLFERRFEAGITPLQFAIAGMNAHINNDLAIALVAASGELGYDLELDSPHHRDHLRVNATLARVMCEVEERFDIETARTAHKAWGTLADIRTIERARNHAWTRARTLVALDDEPFLSDQYQFAVARVVGFASRTLLMRTV